MEHQPDRIDVEELVERLKGLAAEGALIHTFSWGLVVSLLSDAATALSALEKERDEAREGESRWLLRVSAIREASGLGAKPMLDELPAEIAKIVSERDALKALVGRMVEGLEQIAEQATEFEVARAARSLLSEAKGEGER